MNYRNNNIPNYYENANPRLGYSNVSKGFGYSNRSIFIVKVVNANDDHNLGEV